MFNIKYYGLMAKESDQKKQSAPGRYTKILEGVGLNNTEAVVYEVLLDKGQLGVSGLLKLTPNVNRTNLYSILYSLRDKGIIEQTIKDKKINFKPLDPYKIKDYVFSERENYLKASKELDFVLPDLLSTFNLAVNKPSVRYYEGISGLEKVYNELNNSGVDELLLIRSVNDSDHPELKKVVVNQVRKQVKKNIRTKAITSLVISSRQTFQEEDRMNFVERRLVDKEKLSIPAQIMIWADTVAITNMKGKLISSVIENKNIATTFRIIFDYIWSSSGDYHRKISNRWRSESVIVDPTKIQNI